MREWCHIVKERGGDSWVSGGGDKTGINPEERAGEVLENAAAIWYQCCTNGWLRLRRSTSPTVLLVFSKTSFVLLWD